MQEIVFQLPHLRLQGLQQGDINKPVILALHGWLDNAASFLPLVAELDLSEHQLIALDMAGHGHSQHRSADAHYHLVDWIQDIHQLIESNNWSQVILLGHSLGGIVASLYASAFANKVSKLILLESFGAYSKDPQSSPQQLRESVVSRIEIESKTAKHPASLKNAITARKLAGDMSKASAEILVRRNLLETDNGIEWRTDRRLRTISSLRMTEPQVEAFMQAISCPALVILGDSGFEKLRELLAQRHHWITHLTKVTCAGGHHFHMDHPQPVATQINDFLQNNSNEVK